MIRFDVMTCVHLKVSFQLGANKGMVIFSPPSPAPHPPPPQKKEQPKTPNNYPTTNKTKKQTKNQNKLKTKPTTTTKTTKKPHRTKTCTENAAKFPSHAGTEPGASAVSGNVCVQEQDLCLLQSLMICSYCFTLFLV